MKVYFHRAPALRAGGLRLSAAISLSFGALFTGMPAVQAATDWVSTRSVALADSTVIPSTVPVAASMPMQITVSLNVASKSALDTLVKNQNTPGNPAYHQYLTPAQFAAQYAPTNSQAQSVASYLQSQGFTNVRVSKSRMLVGGNATAAQVEAAFNTQISSLVMNGKTVFINTTDAQVPSSLSSVVMAIGGLQNAVKMQTPLHKMASGTGALPPVTGLSSAVASKQDSEGCLPTCTPASGGTFTPTLFPFTYDVGSVPAGSNTSIAISTYGDDLAPDEGSTVIEDLRNAEASYGLPYVPVEVRLTTPIATPDTSGDGEWDLDTQYSTGMAGNVQSLIIYASDDSVADNLLWEYAAFADAADAKVGNMSYGQCELFSDATITSLPGVGPIFSQVVGEVSGIPTIQSADVLFEQAVSEGLSWHASSGDSGGYCTVGNVDTIPGTGVPGGANYPTSSPFVVSVGGTSLITDSSYDYLAEFAWESTGGGISVVEAPPSWQESVVPSALATSTTSTSSVVGGRGVPDIAMFSGTDIPNVIALWGAELYVAGTASEGNEVYLGTSLSSPLAVGTWARYETACDSKTLGFAAPDYYALASALPPYTATGFNDVILGSNAFYTALPGWDYTTGFGSIDISALYSGLVAQGSCLPASTKPLTDSTLMVVGENTTMDNAGLSSITLTASDTQDSISYWVVDFGDGKPGAAGTGISATSTTAPNPDVQIQPTVSWVNQDCATTASQEETAGVGSSSCATYPAAFSGSAYVFNHQYAAAGTYTVKAWVRNSNGVVSPAYTFTVAEGSTTSGMPSATGGAIGGVPTTGTGSGTGTGTGSGETVTVSLSATPTSGTSPLQVAFTATASTSNGTAINSYTYFFGDGSPSMTSTSGSLSFTYAAAGTFEAQVVATDANGFTASSSTVQITSTASVTVTGSDQAIAEMTVTPTSGSIPLTVQFDGSRSVGANGDSITTYTFDFGDGTPGVSGSSATVSHVYTAVGTYQPTLTVTDSQGDVSPNKAVAKVSTGGTPGSTEASSGSTGSTPTSSGSGAGSLELLTLLPLMLVGLRRRQNRK